MSQRKVKPATRVLQGSMAMKLETKVFELSSGKYTSLSELARAMGLTLSYVSRVRQGKRDIGKTFVIGAVKAFPGYTLDDLFSVVPNGSQNERRLGMSNDRARQIVKRRPSLRKSDLQSRLMLTTNDVAKLLGLHPNTVRRWCKQGLLKSYRIGRRSDRRFRREDIDVFLRKAEPM